MKRLVGELENEIPHVRSSMLRALGNAVPSHLLDHTLFDFASLSTGIGNVESELDIAIGHTDEELTPTLVSIN
jgi:tRNA 2-thiocytidine biosynthesis protein TtcA